MGHLLCSHAQRHSTEVKTQYIARVQYKLAQHGGKRNRNPEYAPRTIGRISVVEMTTQLPRFLVLNKPRNSLGKF